MGEQLISRSEGRRRAGDIGRTTEFRLIRDDPDWPRPVQITAGKSGYSAVEIDAWVRKRIDERDQKEPVNADQFDASASPPEGVRISKRAGRPVRPSRCGRDLS
jgi:predicted DNA-binding transcriptional regulator AlpA